MCHCQEDYLGRHVAVVFVLASSHGAGNKEQDEPGNPHLIEHFKVQDSDPGIQLSAHEEIVYRIARKSMGSSSHNRLDVNNEAIQEAR